MSPSKQVLIDPEELQRRQISLQACLLMVWLAAAPSPPAVSFVGGGQERRSDRSCQAPR